MSLSPWFRSPLTDFSGAIVTHQWYGRCRDFEMRAIECLEAYGLDKGIKKCEDLMTDFQECALKSKENARLLAMRMERERQYRKGERSKEDRYAEAPPADSY